MVAWPPKCDIHLPTSATTTELAVILFNGIVSTQQVNLSIQVRRYLKLLDIGEGSNNVNMDVTETGFLGGECGKGSIGIMSADTKGIDNSTDKHLR